MNQNRYIVFYRNEQEAIDTVLHSKHIDKESSEDVCIEFQEAHPDASVLIVFPDDTAHQALFGNLTGTEQTTDVDRFAVLLAELDNRDLSENTSDQGFIIGGEEISNGYYLVHAIRSITDDFLITRDGQPNFRFFRQLENQYGYKVGPGETDAFGWVTGIIYLKKGKLVFG